MIWNECFLHSYNIAKQQFNVSSKYLGVITEILDKRRDFCIVINTKSITTWVNTAFNWKYPLN